MSAEFRLSDEHREALVPFIWGGWIGVAKGRENQFASELRGTVERIVAEHVEAAERALVERCQQFYAWWREQPRVIGSGESDRLRAFGDLLHDHLTRPDIGATP